MQMQENFKKGTDTRMLFSFSFLHFILSRVSFFIFTFQQPSPLLISCPHLHFVDLYSASLFPSTNHDLCFKFCSVHLLEFSTHADQQKAVQAAMEQQKMQQPMGEAMD